MKSEVIKNEVIMMGESKGEGGSWLYGIILILSGGFILVTGILYCAGIGPIAEFFAGMSLGSLSILASAQGWIYMAIGGWGVIGGIGLIKDQEWGWGISLVVLSTVIITFLADVIAGIVTANWADVMMWIKLIALIVAAVGIVYLLATKEKYA